MNKYAIIVAGGSGLRMGTEIPKQFLLLAGKPILSRTLEAFHKADPSIKLIVALPEDQTSNWNKLLVGYNIKIEHKVVQGGSTRFESVKNGLDSIGDGGLVAIHDGVRPLVSTRVINNSFDHAMRTGNAVVSVRLKDSIRELTGDMSTAKNRTDYRLMQTPQTFKVSLIKEAFEKADNNLFTDDAGVFESNGGKIELIEGEYENIKITTPEDLTIAEALFARK